MTDYEVSRDTLIALMAVFKGKPSSNSIHKPNEFWPTRATFAKGLRRTLGRFYLEVVSDTFATDRFYDWHLNICGPGWAMSYLLRPMVYTRIPEGAMIIGQDHVPYSLFEAREIIFQMGCCFGDRDQMERDFCEIMLTSSGPLQSSE